MFKYLLIAILLLTVTFVRGQELNQDTIVVENKTKNFEFSLMPYLSYNRDLKFLIGLIPMTTYRVAPVDTLSPKSMSGLAAVYATNGSYFVCMFHRIFLNEDRWRIQMYAVTGDRYSQYFTDAFDEPGFYGYGTKTTMASIGAQRKLTAHLYGGLTYTYANYYTVYEDDLQPDSKTQTNGLEVSMMLDKRSDFYYPTTGSKSKLRWIAFPEWFGNDEQANKIIAEYNNYTSVRGGKDVVAGRASGKFGLGDIAFEQQVVLGGKDIRGYSKGQYRGDGYLALQGEYRFNFSEKMGVVGFAGLATIYGSDTNSFNWKLYPGIGGGYRYSAFKDMKFNIGLDAAVGKEDWGVYFRIGEAF